MPTKVRDRERQAGSDRRPGAPAPSARGLRAWLWRTPISNPLHLSNAVTLQLFALTVAIGTFIIEVGRLATGYTFRSPRPSLYNFLTIAVIVLAVRALRRGRYWQGVFLFVGAMSAVFAVRIALGGFTYSRAVLPNVAIPLALAALLLGRRALWLTLLGYLGAVAFAIARDHHLLGGSGPRPPPESLLGGAAIAFIVYILFAIVLDRFGLTMRDAWAAAVARQAELEATTRELRRTNEALAAEMEERERLERELRQAQKMEAVGRLAGGVAHDFNNLLTVIATNLELLRTEATVPPPVREGLEEIAAATSRGAQLTRQLLAFGRRQVIEPRAVDLGAQITSLRTMLQRLLGEEVELRFTLASGLPPVLADPGQLEQILVNLVVNARDAISTHGHIEVATRLESLMHAPPGEESPPGEYAVLSVRDDGRGMTPEVQAHLFEPFFTTKEVGRGTGLGLSMVYGIARQHGGFVRVDSQPGRGSTFRVYLPLAGRPVDAPRPAAPAREPARGSGTLLLAEDDDAVRASTTALLERLGYRVLAAPDGARALELCRRHDGAIRALVTDAVMPHMNGRELADELQKTRPGTPVVFLSGYTEDVIASRGVLEEGVVLVRKPFEPAELAAAIEAAIAGSG